MKIRTIIVDDDSNWRMIIGKFVKMIPTLELVASCESAMEGYAQLMSNEIELIICDIEMPNLTGIGFIKSLKSPPLVIFVTSHRDYALDCYEVSPVDFLMKPLDYERFIKSIEKVRQRLVNPPEVTTIRPYFFIRENQQYIQIAHEEVLYMKAQENFVQIITKGQTYLPTLTLSKMEEQLKSDAFLRVHRSYIVNRDAIKTINKDEVFLVSGDTIPIGEQYRGQITQKHIAANLISRTN